MIILPAIDILDGQCVRLYKGEYDTARKVAHSAEETIKSFISAGAEYVHTVDLNGAKSGKQENADILISLAKKYDIPIELGGGIRNMESVKYCLDGGISRVILGSAAIRDPEFLKRAVGTYGEKIAVGIDAKDGLVSVSGWTETENTDYLSFAKKMQSEGVKNIIFTDIAKDGTLEGPNLSMLKTLCDNTNLDITASGGVKDINDIKSLLELDIYGAIAGRSIYDGTLDLKEAIELTVN